MSKFFLVIHFFVFMLKALMIRELSKQNNVDSLQPIVVRELSMVNVDLVS